MSSEEIFCGMDADEKLYEIKACLDHLSEGVGTFDPIQVINRMYDAFPEMIKRERDHLWETCDYMLKRKGQPGADGAFRIAVRDMQERGPAILFEIPLADGRLVKGVAERYWVNVNSVGSDFPADFRARFTDFLKSLFLQPIQIIYSSSDLDIV